MNIEQKKNEIKMDLFDTCMLDHDTLKYIIQEYLHLLPEDKIDSMYEELFSYFEE